MMLVFLEGENEGVEIKLTPPRELTLGRSEECDVFLGEKKISRKHLTIVVRKDAVIARDLGSTNGSFVNKKKISEVALQDTDSVKVGASVIQVLIKRSKKEEIAVDAPTAIDLDESEEPTGTNPRQKPVQEISLDEALEEDQIRVDTDDVEEDDDDAPIVEYEPSVVYEASEPDGDPPSDPSLSLDETMSEGDSESISEDIDEDSGLGLSQEHSLDQEPSLDLDEEGLGDDSSDSEIEIDLDSEDDGEDSLGQLSLDDSDEESQAPSEDDLEIDLTGDPQQVDFSVPEYQDEHSEVSQIKGKALSGDLAAMSFADLLQNIDQNKKTGYVELTNKQNNQTGEVLILKGSLRSASVGAAQGKKAIYRLITWKKGSFVFHPLEESDEKFDQEVQKPIEDSIESVLMEGFRQYDELKKIRKVLPKPEQKLSLKKNPASPLSKLHPRVLDILQIVIASGNTQEVLDQSTLSDLETSKVIFFLIKKGYIDLK